MNRRFPFCVMIMILTAALALAASPSLFAQTQRQTRRSHSTAAKTNGLGFGVPESLSGTIQMVVADQNLLVVNGPSGVPYDMKVTPRTLVVVNEKRGTIQSLADQVGKSVTVAFVPRRNGDFATRVEVTD